MVESIEQTIQRLWKAVDDSNRRIAHLENRSLREGGERFEVWAERQLEKLSTGVKQLTERHEGLVKETTVDQRFKELKRLMDLRTLSDDSEIEGNAKAVATLNDRVSNVESRLDAYGIPEVRGEYHRNGVVDRDAFLRAVEEKFEAQETKLEADEDFSPPIGGRQEAVAYPTTLCPGTPHRGHTRSGDPCPKELTAHGAAVRETVLDEVELRIREYMTPHFSEATIAGVVRAVLQGEGKYSG